MSVQVVGSCLYELQRAIFLALSGDKRLSELSTGTFDGSVPQGFNVQPPYCVMDSWTEVGDDVLNRAGRQATFLVHIYSTRRGLKEGHMISDRVLHLLREARLELGTVWYLAKMRFEDSLVLTETDEVRHAAIRFRAFVHERAQ